MKPHFKLSLDGSIKPAKRNLCDWHSADVISSLHKAGTNLRKLAHLHGYAHINDVLTRPWVAAELIVATALKTTPEDIWPSRYQQSRARAIALTRNPQAIKKYETTFLPNATSRRREEALAGFRATGISIPKWAAANGFSVATVKGVLYGHSQGLRGEAHKVAVALGLKSGTVVAATGLKPVLVKGQVAAK